ncbi:MAG: dihydrolipoamide acetyltransferase family protein [Desulfobacteria bacterium]
MTLRELLMPKLGLTMQEGTIAEWKVSPGQSFRARDVLVVVETEKVAYEVEAETDGILGEILVPATETVPVGAAIARWTATGDGKAAAVDVRPATNAIPPPAAEGGGPAGKTPERSPAAAPLPRGSQARVIATPLARRIAREHGIELSGLQGGGPSGRIRAADVENARLEEKPPAPVPGEAKPGRGVGGETRAPAGTIQSAMARRLIAVKRDVPHFYLASEADATALLQMKDSLNADSERRKITVNHLVVASVGRALVDLPWANRVWSEGDLVTFGSADVGIAVHTERGLFVPILREAGRSILDDVVARSEALVAKAREGKLGPDDVSGGAIAVSNAGMFNVTYLTPIISPGHSAILGVGSVRELFRSGRAGEPELRREIGLVLACDHRVLDGVAGLKILNRIIHYLQNPIHLLVAPGAKR